MSLAEMIDANLIWANIISQTISYIPIYVIIILGYMLGKKLITAFEKLGKEMPKWISQVSIEMKHSKILNEALESQAKLQNG